MLHSAFLNKLLLQHISASVLGHLQGARNFVQLLCQDGIKYYIYIYIYSCTKDV
jgi:hypothetical protein